ncbi:hypothetical protein [Streptomyces clavuligerus]|uniref:Secreted serine-rich protein n=1 Tax=Streptomyces clavuligerus TaxID=1901 RepID=E2Q195_STRCL|nr:hypothetical protein [Streptomyces clavuligerus]ANW18727.1 hypothetical protein BB341_11045 [Streptomyces clavuligerus]AXU13293.1 hypothetical protein D1794_11420 [Streptomyces clavuligerus]EFG08600.1 Secreted serine-rich protein [Streptomyces clavuligerus]MBY6303245.1 hypothetical protein [Streptomyces clavuligerus]QCS06077.1 hypothetical protein CRV15_10850 [Streptomyces clavuligerus]
MQRWAYTTRREGPRSRAGRAGRSSTGRHPGNRPYAPGLAAALIALVVGAVATGCTAGASDEGATGDAKAGSGARTVAQPGKYRTLLEPCGAVADATLRELLPGIAELPEDQQRAKLRGEAAGTFDSDRRVGCAWRAASATGAAHTLTLDFERVVSYDAGTSDTDRAAEVYGRKQSAVFPPGTPGAPPSPSATGSSGPPPSSGSGSSAPPSSSSASAPGASGAPGDTAAAEPVPRVLDDLGDAAFINDVLSAAGGGSTAQRRTVSVVFRTSNVVATVVYTEHSGRVTDVPDSKELQDRARKLAEDLAGEFG